MFIHFTRTFESRWLRSGVKVRQTRDDAEMLFVSLQVQADRRARVGVRVSDRQRALRGRRGSAVFGLLKVSLSAP